MAYVFVTYVEHGWRWVQIAAVPPVVIQLLFAGLLPESPRHLVRKGMEKEARTTLLGLRHEPTRDYLDENIAAMQAEAASATDASGVTWREVFANRRVIKIGFGLMFFQPLTGINAVMFYSTKIFSFAGVESDILASVSVTALNVVMTIVCVFLVDRAGRRQLLLIGTTIMVLSLGALSLVLLTLNSNTSLQGVLAVIGVLVYVAGFAIGLGAVSWVLMGELLNSRVRAKAFSLFTAENWACNLLLGMTVLTAIEGLGGGSSDDQQKKGVAYLFIIFGALALAAVLFILTIPETKGKTLEEIQRYLADSSATASTSSGSVQNETLTSALLSSSDSSAAPPPASDSAVANLA